MTEATSREVAWKKRNDRGKTTVTGRERQKEGNKEGKETEQQSERELERYKDGGV